jgi:hypothetical protein
MKRFKSHHGILDFLDVTVILFHLVIQILNLVSFNKTDQSSQHQQDVDIFQPDIICTAFIHDDFLGKTFSVIAFLKNVVAAASYPSSESMKSRVLPNLSMARYK